MFEAKVFQNPNMRNGPLQIVHDFRFVALNLKDEYKWLEDADPEQKLAHITWRMERLKARGYGGIVLNVGFKHYMEDEAAWQVLDKTVDLARDLGLRIWIYDEQYYPSGSAGGLTLRDHPEYEAQGLVCVTQEVSSPASPVRIASPLGHSALVYAYAVPKNQGRLMFDQQINISHLSDHGGGLCWTCPGGEWKIYCFFTRALYEGTYLCRALRAPRRNISVCNKKAVQHFLDITFDPYIKKLGSRMQSSVEAIFTDEPSLFWHTPYPADFDPDQSYSKLPTESMREKPNMAIPLYAYIPWTDDLETQFMCDHQYALCDHLPALFEGTPEAVTMRLDFYDTINTLFDRAYNQQFQAKLQPLNVDFSGHMIHEERFEMHPSSFGDILRNLGSMDIPGCDLLYSDPERIRYSIACKLASSAAHLYRRDHVMIEASNMSDKQQEFSLAQIKCAMAIEFAHGVDTITSYYGENLFSEEEYAQFTKYIARLHQLLAGGIHQTQALVYYPFRQLASLTTVQNPFEADDRAAKLSQSAATIVQNLMMRQIDFDYINDEKLRECVIEEHVIRTPGDECPGMILFPEIDFVEAETAAFIDLALERQVSVVFAGPKRPIAGLDHLDRIVFLGDAFALKSGDFAVASDQPLLLCLHKKFTDHDIYFIVNTGTEAVQTGASIPVPANMKSHQGITLQKLNLDEGSVLQVPFTIEQGRICLEIGLDACTASAYVIG